jgi:CheY-like chemotaxis protein
MDILIKSLFILDDDFITTHLMGEILKDVSFVGKFHIENNGWHALEHLQKLLPGDTFPDVLLIDLKMPEMDGFEFIEYYEQQFFAEHPEASLVVITSSVSEKDKQRALGYKSVSRFMLKPFTEKALFDIARQRSGMIN